jgi:hypothetical protein
MSKTVSVEKVDARQLLKDVAAQQQEVVVLSEDGKPMVTVVPFGVSLEERRQKALEDLRTKYPMRIVGDIVEPLEDEWDVMK